MNNTTVVQAWLLRCSWKEQSVLLCGLRGPDAAGHAYIKAWVRWLRAVILQNASPTEKFMQDEGQRHPFHWIDKQNPEILNGLSVHYLTHLMHALQIVGVRHPDRDIAADAWAAYMNICDYMHLPWEQSANMTERLRDQV